MPREAFSDYYSAPTKITCMYITVTVLIHVILLHVTFGMGAILTHREIVLLYVFYVLFSSFDLLLYQVLIVFVPKYTVSYRYMKI